MSAETTRTYYGLTLHRRPGTVERRWSAFTADRWVFASTLEGIKEAIREANGMDRRPNGQTYRGRS